MFLTQPLMSALDADKNGEVTKAEFEQTFMRWFEAWNTDHSGSLTEEQLRDGINKELMAFRGGPPRMGFGPPDDFQDPPDDMIDF